MQTQIEVRNKLQSKTVKGILENLDKYGKTTVVRPTGFGKTHMITFSICTKFEKVLYLYPTNHIKNDVVNKCCEYYGLNYNDYKNKDSIENITFVSYMKLIRMTKEELKGTKYNLVVCDEAHRLGGTMTKKAFKKLIKLNKDTKFIGLTATPNRSDAYDVVDDIFDNVNVFEYTLHDAIQDGLIQKPYYIYFTYDSKNKVRKDVENEIKNSEDLLPIEKAALEKSIIEIANLYNIETVVSKVCHEIVDKDYLKFICFFSNFEHLQEKSEEVIKWFSQAYPDYKIRTLTITSQNTVTYKNVKLLRERVYEPNTIDLIFAVNILNEGYHVDDITGIIMYRTTYSDTIYAQQLGRGLSSSSSVHPIVFDVVNNININGLYDCYDRNTVVSVKARKMQEEIANGTYKDFTEYTKQDGTVIQVPKDYFYDEENDEFRLKWKRKNLELEPEDLLGTGVAASYREVIKKAVAESMLQRCKMAFAAHFRVWCNEHKVPFPISDKELTQTYGLNKEDFNDYFKKLIETHKFNYPMGDAKKLLSKDSKFDLIANVWHLSAEQVVERLLNV